MRLSRTHSLFSQVRKIDAATTRSADERGLPPMHVRTAANLGKIEDMVDAAKNQRLEVSQ